ncbi:MAG: thioredoxin domain-containing protein, partial [Candidatus Bathyarchaeota archaeon]
MLNSGTRMAPNALIDEKSPYLLQHAYNPVDWHAWNKESLKRAKIEDKPIFLSIGYFACHWCHVMEKESFENPQTAKILNKNFVNIKVDREERPDLDGIYMKAVSIITGHGGWPLSIFLTPDLKPFSGGTYFPPEPKQGLPSFNEVLANIARLWQEQRQQIKDSAEQVFEFLRKTYSTKLKETEISPFLLDNAYEQLALQFDTDFGGFGNAPKFPIPSHLSFLLRYYLRKHLQFSLNMVTKTLYAMAKGGIYDQLAGGFHRYSTDRFWLIPHFEKMLYDNALLTKVYLETFQITGDPFFAKVANKTLEWTLREMTDTQGGFYSAVDADSEGTEGNFYVWTPGEIRSVLGDQRGEIFCKCYGVTTQGNFEKNKSVLHVVGNAINEKNSELKQSCLDLRKNRNQRIRPNTDDKIITELNGLMISAMVSGYQVLGDERFLKASKSAAEFILDHLQRRGKLLRRYRDGEAAIEGTVSDYASFVMALIDLYEATFDLRWIKKAIELNETMVEIFLDQNEGGFFLQSNEIDGPDIRLKEAYD